MKHFNYRVEEEYRGEKIVVSVCEHWLNRKLEGADVSCPKYSVISRTLGNKNSKKLTVSDVHDAILKEIIIAEESIDFKQCNYYDNLHQRKINIIVVYSNEEIMIPIIFNPNSSDVVVYCPSSAESEVFQLENNDFRYAIIHEIGKCKVFIDNGYSFPGLSIINRVKKNVKKIFNYN